MNGVHNSASSLTDAKRLFDRMLAREVRHHETEYPSESTSVLGPALKWSANGFHLIEAVVVSAQVDHEKWGPRAIRTHVHVTVIRPQPLARPIAGGGS